MAVFMVFRVLLEFGRRVIATTKSFFKIDRCAASPCDIETCSCIRNQL
jgi:hypothetical protein